MSFVRSLIILIAFAGFKFEARRLILKKTADRYIAILKDSVKIYNDTIEVSGDYGIYDDYRNVFFIKGQVKVKQRNIRIVADSLLVLQDSELFYFMGNVVFVKDGDTIKAELLKMIRDSLIAINDVKGNIKRERLRFITDTLHATKDSTYLLHGEHTKIVLGDSDTVLIYTKWLSYLKDTTFSPYPSKMLTGKYTISGDTFFYFTNDSTGLLLGEVVVEWDSGRIDSDTGFFYMSGQRLDSVYFFSNVRIQVLQSDSSILQVRGDTAKIFIQGDSLKLFKGTNIEGEVIKDESTESGGT